MPADPGERGDVALVVFLAVCAVAVFAALLLLGLAIVGIGRPAERPSVRSIGAVSTLRPFERACGLTVVGSVGGTETAATDRPSGGAESRQERHDPAA